MASFNGHIGCVRELLSSGAVVDLADEVSICIGSMLIRGPSHHYFGNCMRTNMGIFTSSYRFLVIIRGGKSRSTGSFLMIILSWIIDLCLDIAATVSDR